MFHRFRPRRVKMNLPEGLKDLMRDISREILRQQPPNIYESIADYLESLLSFRNISRIAERTLVDIHTMSKNIYDKFVTSGLQIEYEHKILLILRRHLERFCLAEMSNTDHECRQKIIEDLIDELTYLFDDKRINHDSIRIILETAFQVFARALNENNNKIIDTVHVAGNSAYCQTERWKILSDEDSSKPDKSDVIFLKNFKEHIENCMK